MGGIGALLGKIDGFFRNLGKNIRTGIGDLFAGPLQGVLFAVVLSLTGVLVVVETAWKWLDKGLGWAERVLIVVATLGMTALVFDSYLIEQSAVFTAPAASESETEESGEQPDDAPAEEAATSPDAAPAAPPVTPAPAPADGPALVTLTGDGEGVTITGDAGTFDLPGEIPPGTYTARATFPGYDAPMDAGEITLEPGPIEVKCSSFAESCRTREAKGPPPAATPAPAPPSGDNAVVTLTGDGEGVTITGDAGTFDLPGEIPPGTYTARATFPGYDAPMDAGEITLEPGPIEVKCSSFAESCRTREAKGPPPAATPAPAPTPAPSGDNAVVTLTGDGESVTITGDAGTFDLPGEIPPGTYTARATFPGYDAPMDAGEITLEQGPIEVKCSSFAESCRTREAKGPPPAATPSADATADAQPAAPEITVPVTLRGGGSDHYVNAPERIDLPGEVPVGSWTVMATFPDVGETAAGTLLVEESDSKIALWCSEGTWQCLPDEGWWNPWRAEGQINLALMLMVALGFLGASIATQDRNHLSVDAVDRVLSPAPARLVKRLTSLVAAGFCAVMAYASWEKIIDPDASGDTFPGAKVWWWMVKPLNAATNLMPGDTFGPGAEYASRSSWEEQMIAQGLEWPFGLAYETVQIGSAFPLWVSLLVLVAAFGMMTLRFGAMVISPPAPPLPDLPQAPKPTSRRPADVILAGAFPGAIITLGLAVWLGQGWMIIVASLLLVFMGAPLFIGVGVGTLAGWMLIQDVSATSLVSDMFEATKKQEIIAIPFFVLAGNLMTHGSIAKRLIGFARAVVGPLPGGLGVAGVVACAIFAAISGSSPATVIAIGAILFPMLVKQGYDEKFSLGLLTTSGGLGIIIPPSVPMIIFAVMVSNPGGIVGVVSPVELFLGGFGPGLLIAGALVLYTMYANWPRPGTEGGPLPPGADPDDDLTGNYGKDLGRTFVRGVASLLLPVFVLGGIYGGNIGSPFVLDVTQAAAFAVVYALFVELIIHRELKFTDVPKVCIETASMIGSLFLILVIAISLNKLLAELGVPDAAAQSMLAWADDPFTFLLLVNLFLLALGTVMDIVSAILIVAPLLAPIAAQYGIHPIHFGIMFIVNLELGYLTPPMGINLFVASTTFKRNLVDVIRGVVPFLILMLVCLAAIVWIPRWMHGVGLPIPGLPALLETQVETPQVDGPRTPVNVGKVVRSELAELRACAPAELSRRASGVFTLTIQPDGTVSEISVAEQGDGFEGDGTAKCLSDALKEMGFGALEGDDAAVSTASLTLRHVP